MIVSASLHRRRALAALLSSLAASHASAQVPTAAAPAEAAGTAPTAPAVEAGEPASAAPPPEVDAAPAPPPALEPEPLPALETVADVSEAGGPKLEFYGFGDANYIHLLTGDDESWAQFVAPEPSFFVGHLNLYMAASLGPSWRSLAEVRFTYAPLFDEDVPEGEDFPAKDVSTGDYADLAGTIGWSGIEMQRAWVEYQPLDFLTIRAGQFFTPYGYWNDDHGSPTILAMVRPFPINVQLFPERQTGLEVYGSVFIKDWTLAYFLTLSNGRGPYSAIRDLDSNKAIGGRLQAQTSAYGDLSFGVSAYRGKSTASRKRFRLDTTGSEPKVEFYRTKDAAFHELSLGVDARFAWRGLLLQTEVMLNEAAYDEDARPRVQGFDPRPAFVADYRRWGGYALLGYTLPWLELTPYVMGEHTSYTDSDYAPPVSAATIGANYRATPVVVLKAEYRYAWWHSPGSLGLGDIPIRFLGGQVAWAF